MPEIEEITGNFPGWEYISLILGLLLLAASVFLFVRFIRAVKCGRLFSFYTVSKLGCSLFFLVLALYRIRYFVAYGNDGTFYLMVISTIFSARNFMLVAIPVLLVFALGLIVSNIVLIIREGFALYNLYATAFGFLMIFADAMAVFIEYHMIDLFLPNAVINAWYFFFCYFSCLFFAVVSCAIIAAARTPDLDKDYVLILGCKIKDDGTLYPIVKGRADRALSFAVEQYSKSGKSPKLMPTGGKGDDERCSEAEAIGNYLLSEGFDRDKLVSETKSRTTRENMLFSRKLIDSDDAKVAFSTSDFHVFRSGILASGLGWNIDGMGAKTKWYFWPNAFIREFIGLLAATWKNQVVAIALISAFGALLTVFI